MLGFDAIGRLSLGQLPKPSVVQVFLNGTINFSARQRAQFSGIGVLAGRVAGQVKVRASTVPVTSLTARLQANLSMRSPGGFGLSGRIALAAKARTPGGVLLYARMALMSSAMSSIHIEGTIIGDHRDPLLLNSGSQYGASYWRGRG